MEKYCNNSWQKIVKLLRSNDEQGLNEKNCEAIRRVYGQNKIELLSKTKLHNFVLNCLKQKSVLIYILIAVLLFSFKQYLYGSMSLLVLSINIILVVQHMIKRNEKINNIRKVMSTEAVVIRNGIQKNIPSEELVIGDIVLVYTGCIVPADLRIIDSNNLKVYEKEITGEEFVKSKISESVVGSITSLSQMKNILFKGSTIKSGDGLGIVVAIGASTMLGKNASMLTYSTTRKHNLGKMLNSKLERYLLAFAAIIISWLAFFVVNNQEYGVQNMMIGLVSLGLAPIMLIMVLGKNNIMKFLLKDNIKIFNFSVFNLIEDINVLFIDKVGAISKKEMSLKKLYLNEEMFSTDDPYIKEVTFDRMIEIALVCNNGIYNTVDNTINGEIDEVAYLRYALRKKITKKTIDSMNRKLFDIPRDLDKQFISVVSKVNRGCRVNSRGNVDAILDRCTHIMIGGIEKELNDEYKAKIREVDMNLSLQGLITQGFAYRNFNYEPSKDENVESNMVFVGLTGLENPLEDNLEKILNKVRDKGILPIVFTEESKLSAISSCKKAKIVKNSNQVIAGIELDSLNEQELKELLCRARVFCRVDSEIKSKIVSLFIRDGYKAATTGENIEDLSVLNLSHVGISKGNCSNMLQELSDVYIKENYLDGFLKIKKYAKRLKENIQRAFKTYFMMILSEVIILITSSLIGQNNSISFYDVIILNVLFSIPIICANISSKGRDISIYEMIFRAGIISAICSVCMYKVNSKDVEIIPVTLIGVSMILSTLFKGKISLRKFSNELMMVLIGFLIILGGIGGSIIINNIMINDIILLEIIVSIIFLLVFEILWGKWQDSI